MDRLHRFLMFGVIMLGAGSAVDIFGKDWGAWLNFSTVFCGTLDLTLDLSNRARAHGLMKRRYFDLRARLVEDGENELSCKACLHRYSAEEEPAFKILLKISWNEAQEALYGRKAAAYVIPFYWRTMSNFIRADGKQFNIREKRHELKR